MTTLSDDALIGWLEREGFEHTVEPNRDIRAEGMADEEYWILETYSSDTPSYLVNQDTAIAGRWRVASGGQGQGEWKDVGTDLTAYEACHLLAGLLQAAQVPATS